MTIFVTGSRGKTSSQLATLLHPTHTILIASRTPPKSPAHPTVRFDWNDEATFTNPFDHAVAQKEALSAVYLVSPETADASVLVIRFIHFARSRGVRRFVLLSAWELEMGADMLAGKAHEELERLGREEGVEWAVVRPHFFMENFLEGHHLATITKESKIYSATQNGSKPFIAASDIANVVKVALIDDKPHNTDYVVTGNESLTYDDVAATLSSVLGRTISHVRLDPDAFTALLQANGMHSFVANYLAEIDVKVAGGFGRDPTDGVKKVTGQDPKSFRQFVEEKKEVWM
ncbi:Festuclavine dehydrogenase [Cercospora beticola]|uniref:Festuclavine dehydrogenase n=1 Tax=Cercospora beticola TaxID=122368 RepID=A0A2G5HHY0_CERBT|nr:Festuclavine dehydrogenase [Cercospora beticola]PIA92115.1 Festuclavine dehydrogenase [Cercospora beticola]WPB06504.1 hypothetical protein RHO25_011161 [Cercospora beticola]